MRYASTVLVLLSALATPLVAQADGENQKPEREFTPVVDLGRLPALSQGRAGTCWCYATTSFLESELQRIHGKPIDLSEIYTVYYGYLEKARRYVQLHGKTQFSEGGLSHDVMMLVGRYGAVPEDAYTGLLAGSARHDHSELSKVLTAALEPIATSRRPSPHWEDAVRGILSAYLGEIPTTIETENGTRTPLEWARDDLRIPVTDYVEWMSFADEPYWQQRQLLVPDNWMHYGDYWNVPLDVFMDDLDHALESGYTVAVDIDVSEPGTRNRDYVWVLTDELEEDGAITEEVRLQMFRDRTTTDDHLMHVVGTATDQDGKLFYLTKNSHGNRGPYDGHIYISRNYMAAKALAFMAHEDGLTPKTRARTHRAQQPASAGR